MPYTHKKIDVYSAVYVEKKWCRLVKKVAN